jgi:hypothetical protein
MKVTKAKLKYFIADEKKAVGEYHRAGFHGLEKQERHHMHFLQKKLKAM